MKTLRDLSDCGNCVRTSILFVASISLPLTLRTGSAFDGFNVNSSTFANQYNGSQIWDGATFQNDWTQAGYGAGNDPIPALSLNGTALRITNSVVATPAGAGNNGWVQQDTGSTPWELGTGNWTIELSGKVNKATAAADNFVLWGDGRRQPHVDHDRTELGPLRRGGACSPAAFSTMTPITRSGSLTRPPTCRPGPMAPTTCGATTCPSQARGSPASPPMPMRG